jgi:signal transduction histidine kinase
MIGKSIDSLKRFISDVTDYSRNARAELKYERINLYQLITEIRAGLEFDEKAKKVAWKVQVPEEFTFQTDPYRLRIVLNNLLSNAIKYADLSKSKPEVELNLISSSGKIIFSVTDNGIGIETDKLPNVFKMFYRATQKEKGSGLGLYIAKESVEKLKGKIELQSEFGGGSKFTVTLPVVV